MNPNLITSLHTARNNFKFIHANWTKDSFFKYLSLKAEYDTNNTRNKLSITNKPITALCSVLNVNCS